MFGLRNSQGVNNKDLRDRLHKLGRKARREPKSLTLAELDEICTLTEKLKPEPQ